MKPTKPNFLVVGAGKAGTTSLYHYIKQVDGIFVSEVKEPHYFTAPEVSLGVSNVVTSEDDYYRLFEPGASAPWRGEMSVTYLYYAKQCIPRILGALGPETRIGILLRDPVKRAYSSYLDCFRHNPNENLDFISALDCESERRNNRNLSPMMYYSDMSLYAKNVAAFKKHFKHTKIMLAEDLASDPMTTVSSFVECLDGLHVPDGIDFSRHNSGGRIWKNEKLGALIKGAAIRPVRRFGNKMFPNVYPKLKSSLFKKAMRRADPIPEEAATRLKAFFRNDILELEQVIERDLKHWLE